MEICCVETLEVGLVGKFCVPVIPSIWYNSENFNLLAIERMNPLMDIACVPNFILSFDPAP